VGNSLRYRVLGPLEVELDGGIPAHLPRRQGKLVAVLLVFAGDSCSRDMLVRTLWGDNPPASPGRALGICLCRARQALGPGGCLHTLEDGALRADPEPQDLDLTRFVRLHSAALRLLEGGHLRPASDTLEQALACWRDPPLPDLRFEQTLACWRDPPLADLPEGPGAPEVAARRTRLLEQRSAAWLTLADILLEVGDHQRILPYLQARVIAEPICEHAWAQFMAALYQGGRSGEALAVYSKARTELVRALGTEPGAELQDLYVQILAGTPARFPVLRAEAALRRP
jgi:DNA-binding SARP family transcriptional activator